MARIRILAGTRKGAFILTADGKREIGRSAAHSLRAGRCTTSRVRP